MHELSQWIVTYTVNTAWQIPLVVLVAAIVSRIFRRLGCEEQHRVWVAALFVAVLAPAAMFKQPAASVRLLAISQPHASLGSQDGTASPLLAFANLHFGPALYFTVLFAYLLVLAYASLRLAWGLHKARRLVQRSTRATLTPQAEEMWRCCSRAFAIGRVTIAASSAINGPVTLGARKKVLLVPDAFLADSPQEDLAAALGHECAHIERRDFLRNLLYEIMMLPIAYHPATWFLKSRIAETRELVCDRMAAERVAGSNPYARSLLRLAGAMYARPAAVPNQAIGMFDANALENRVMNLMTPQLPVSATKKAALLASGIALLSLSCFAAVGLRANLEEQPASGLPAIENNDGSKSIQPGGVGLQGAAAQQVMDAAAANPGAKPPMVAVGQTTTTPKVYKIGDGVSAPKLLYAPDPIYPKNETKAGKNTICVLEMIVGDKGEPEFIRVVKSGGAAFDANAIEAARQYRFSPAKLNGEPVSVRVNIEMNFRKE